MNEILIHKAQEIEVLKRELELKEQLPHLYGWKFYGWARQFFESVNHQNLLCAANQISKSSTQIRKSIHWATSKELWPTLWPREPLQFWYLYPTLSVATIEVRKKWIPEFLPRGKMKDHPQYGWKAEIKNGIIIAIHYNTGVSCYFKSYAMDAQDLQTGSVAAMFVDEEPPEALLDELQMRLVATQGYFHAVFTPTLGQEIWRRAFEEVGKRKETFRGAFKQQVSMFDCLHYEDGTKSHWNLDVIQRAINSCKSEAQVQRRVYGKFVSDDGLKYPSFNRSKNVVDPRPRPKDWEIFAGVDVGSGGENHPSAICFMAVNPDRTKGIIFSGWRGDDVITTAGDVAEKVMFLAKLGGFTISRIFYDFASKDFFNIALGMGLNVEPAEKSHTIGEQYLNVLFKNQMLEIFDVPELEPLATEFSTLKSSTSKRNASDDYTDAARYVVTKVPWDWGSITTKRIVTIEKPKTEIDLRREWISVEDQDSGSFQDEVASWNELMSYEGSYD